MFHAKDGVFFYARVQVQVDKATFLVIIVPENLIPYRIVNKTKQKLVVNQQVRQLVQLLLRSDSN